MQKTLQDSPADDGFLSHGPATGGKTLVDRDRVALWWLPMELIGEEDWPRLGSLLSEEERVRSARFHFERDREIYTAAHAACRGLLSYCLGPPPESFRFSVEDHGKPELICPSGEPRFRVNISHTKGCAAVALTQDHDIGVDVEWLQRTAEADALAKRMFADSEYRAVVATSEVEKLDVFLSYWTLKEAYVKAIGKGLSQPLDAFAFDLEETRITFRDHMADDPANWHFERYRLGPKHLMALAVRHPAKERLSVDTRQAPLGYLLDLAGS
ncbi:4'-phosphopantetheinyl transferase family protein [Roseibium aggregatum]|uniref:4'-phosphopantetheinyl transferase superfamily protein n=1 Tax=Roseibium aggregatum TaxID=187304 RepID=A0A939ECZ4_9HYPH|nr:4'-phosphopantetheinyl transferase superfamily protein [Roseibium aggregatum]MBN9669595.1 4'-phosphopantetheinyl transferase superfamily protein [Roseibium aggregatum]